MVAGCRARKNAGDEKGWASVTWRDEHYSPLLSLPSGAALELDWKGEPGQFAGDTKPPQHSCGIKDFRADPVLGPILEHYGPRNWSDGQLTYKPDFDKKADLGDVTLVGCEAKGGQLVATGGGASAVFKLPMPYPYVSAKAEAAGSKPTTLSVSTDGGKSWNKTDGDLSKLVKQTYSVWVKAEFAGTLTKFDLTATVEHNRSALPHLMPGKNRVTVELDVGQKLSPGEVLEVSYAYQEATVGPKKRDRYDGKGVKYGETKTVTKTVDTVPYSFDIEVGGNTPPKMISLTRAVKAK